MEMEMWQKDINSAKILVAILEIANGERTILTSHQQLRRSTGLMPQSRVARCLKALRHEGIIAIRTSWEGTQITILRRLRIEKPQGMVSRQ